MPLIESPCADLNFAFLIERASRIAATVAAFGALTSKGGPCCATTWCRNGRIASLRFRPQAASTSEARSFRSGSIRERTSVDFRIVTAVMAFLAAAT
jgi:hypothetical protein